MKTCSTCSDLKPLSEYSKHGPSKDGLNQRCNACRAIARKRMREADPEKYRAQKKKYYDANVELERARKRADYAKHKESRLEACREYRINNKESVLSANRAWKEKNRGHVNSLSAIQRIRNIDAVRAQAREYIARNKEKVNKANAEYKKNNPHIAAAYQTRRRAKKLNATPKWADINKILGLYEYSREIMLRAGIRHEVDHIVPLLSEFVCGLHCEANLQVIPESENRSKSNRFWPDMPDAI